MPRIFLAFSSAETANANVSGVPAVARVARNANIVNESLKEQNEIFIVMLPAENAIGGSEIAGLNLLHKKIETLPYVNTTFSLAKAKYPIYANSKINFDELDSLQKINLLMDINIKRPKIKV